VSSANNVESVGTVGTTRTKQGSGPNGPNDFDIVGGGQATARGVRDKTRTRVCGLCGREGAAVTARNLRSTGVVWLHDGACLAEWRRPRLKLIRRRSRWHRVQAPAVVEHPLVDAWAERTLDAMEGALRTIRAARRGRVTQGWQTVPAEAGTTGGRAMTTYYADDGWLEKRCSGCGKPAAEGEEIEIVQASSTEGLWMHPPCADRYFEWCAKEHEDSMPTRS
jgi:hypothetical protein